MHLVELLTTGSSEAVPVSERISDAPRDRRVNVECVANTEAGLPKLQAAVRKMEGLLVSRPGQGSPIFLSEDGRRALRDAITRLRQVERLYA